MSTLASNVHHDVANNRFATTVEGVIAHLDYELEAGVLVITHTIVPPAIGGRGIAGQLAQAAFDHARAKGLKVRPECSYADVWARRHHASVGDLLA
ncbi:GNAT family N-acetyltransferase [Aerolutibacter ruishenii]|uniref:N-acetyltransferase domain-containing protein n=1 Tax=Aerolutibacter ruishenii TaxID=686800 RepID=A0A562LWN9_9GAMM|nr:GNAT family N-acetyltransferase [Lysobacter ruishenii]TWI12071.1 hypothetical protein IP93_01352 [Lysobacter ruishenii]